MHKRDLGDLLNTVVEHKRFGLCKIVEITDKKLGKIVVEIVETKETKKVVFSSQFFNHVEEFKTVKVALPKQIDRTRQYKKPDISKYRNHPLVKEIDRKEAGLRAIVKEQESESESEETVEA